MRIDSLSRIVSKSNRIFVVSSVLGKKNNTGEPIYRKLAHCLALRCFDGGFLEDSLLLFLVDPQEQPRVLFGTPFAEHGLSGLSSPHTAPYTHTLARTHADATTK